LKAADRSNGFYRILLPFTGSKPIYLEIDQSILQAISKIVDSAQEQGKSRRKSAAYDKVCEHFKEAFNAVIEC
jgi:hypothetical protein